MSARKAAVRAAAGDARERILGAAERLFAEKGYAATSVQEITEAAEVNKALLYYYFADKRALHVSLINRGIAEFSRLLDEALSSPGSYAERLGAFLQGHVHLLRERADLVRVVQRCVMAGEEEAVTVVQKFRACMEALVSCIAEGMAAGAFRGGDPEMVVLCVIGMLDKIACGEPAGMPRLEAEEISGHVADLLMHGLLREG